MCGGVIFPYRREHRAMLEQLYSPDEVETMEKSGNVRSVYWGRSEPVLPALLEAGEGEGDGVEVEEESTTPQLFLWGNRNKDLPLPATGWARLESLVAGKWDYLRPTPVVIPVTYGVEKGKWFSITKGIRGVLVERDGLQRVYMLTEEAAPDFMNVTKHPRMPVLIAQETFPWLPGEPNGTLHALKNE